MLNIVFPIGGRGERFREKRYSHPKPFIKVGNKTIFDLAVGSYPVGSNFRKIFVVRNEYLPYMPLDCFTISTDTQGPVETIMSCTKLVELINNDEELLVADCDSMLYVTEMNQALDFFRMKNADGGVTTRFSKDPNCSYAQIEDGKVIRTAEKKVISNYSTTGPYWFKTGKDFIRVARQGLRDFEYHVSPLYNYLIKSGYTVLAYPVSTFTHLGTPDALEEYAYNHHLQVEG